MLVDHFLFLIFLVHNGISSITVGVVDLESPTEGEWLVPM